MSLCLRRSLFHSRHLHRPVRRTSAVRYACPIVMSTYLVSIIMIWCVCASTKWKCNAMCIKSIHTFFEHFAKCQYTIGQPQISDLVRNNNGIYLYIVVVAGRLIQVSTIYSRREMSHTKPYFYQVNKRDARQRRRLQHWKQCQTTTKLSESFDRRVVGCLVLFQHTLSFNCENENHIVRTRMCSTL